MWVPRNKKLVAGAAALTLLAGGAGAVAATQLSSSNPRQAYIDDVASRLNVTPAALTGAMKQALIDRIDAAQAAGKLTAAQASAAKRRVDSGGGVGLGFKRGAWRPGLGRFGQAKCSTATPCQSGPSFGPYRRFGPSVGPDRGLGFGFGPRAVAIGGAATTSYLGISAATLRSDLSAGKSLAQIASTTAGKSVSGLESAIKTAATTQLDKAVAAGRITSTQKDKQLATLSAGLPALVNQSFKLPSGRRWFRFRAPAAAPSAPSAKPAAPSAKPAAPSA
jgi:hypothetical protein